MEDEIDFLNRLQQIAKLNDEIDFSNKTKMDKSDYSTASTNNTDIFVLDTNESHYGDIDASTFLDQHSTNIEASFTVLNVPSATPYASVSTAASALSFQNKHKIPNRMSSDEIDESTEVLMLSKADERMHHLKSGISGTDSDVEVLMSEEIVDSDWSGGDDLLKANTYRKNTKNEENLKTTDESIQIKSFESNIDDASGSIKGQSSTDQDISSVEDFANSSSMGGYEQLTKKELINIVRDQVMKIESLEIKLNRYRALQQTFFDYVSDLKHQLEDVNQEEKR